MDSHKQQCGLIRSSLVLASLMACVSLAAQEILEPIDVVASPEGQQQLQTGDVVHEEFTGTHRRIADEEVARQDVSVATILANQPGVQDRRAGGLGSFSSITIRAATAAQTGVYLDGILLNSGGNAVIDLSLLDMLSFAAIDIYQGSTPAQLGQGTLGGGVNFSSQSRLGESPDSRLLFGIGSFNTRQLQLSDNRKTGRLESWVALNWRATDNRFFFNNNNNTPLNPSDDRRERRNNTQADQLGGLLKLGWRHSQTRRSDFLFQASQRDLGVPNFRNGAANDATLESLASFIQLSHTVDAFYGWNTRYTLYANDVSDNFLDLNSQIGLLAQDTQSTANTFGLRSYWERLGANHNSSATLDLRTETFDSDDRLDDRNIRSANRNAALLTLQTTRFLLADRLLVAPSLRVEAIDNDFNQQLNTETRRAAAQGDTRASLQLGTRYSLGDDWQFRANVGQFYREPTFGELFAGRGLFKGNADLLPEEGINADLGFEWQGDGKRMGLGVFASWRDELISTVFNSQGVGQALNLGEARIFGIEASGAYSLSPHLEFNANLTVQDAVSLQEFAAFNNRQLPGEARYEYYARLKYHKSRWSAAFEVSGDRERFYDQANVLPAENSQTENLLLSWQQGDLEATFSWLNLADRQSEDFNGFPRPGRSFSFNVSYRL